MAAPAFDPADAPPPPAPLKLAGAAAGDSASTQALRRLQGELASLRAEAVVPFLHEALARLREHDSKGASEWALKALGYDPESGYGWYVLAIAQEKAGDFAASVQCYEKALALLPNEAEICNDLGRLAYRLGMLTVAEKLFHRYLVQRPGAVEGVNNLACCFRDQMRYDEAVELLRPMIYAEPHHVMLWNTLGTVLVEQGHMPEAITFFDEALRLDPDPVKARYNRANACLALGRPAEALTEVDRALSRPGQADETVMMRLARATMLIASGDLARGWDAYEARLDPQYADCTHYLANRPRWSPEDDLRGRSLLVVGEQGLGDEVMFAGLIPEVLDALGPDGRLTLAVEPRLVFLFQRSFPRAHVEPHGTYKIGHRTVRAVMGLEDWDGIDLWTPMASLLRGFRTSLEAFPDRRAFLQPDPERVAHWRAELAAMGEGPKVGVLWKSLKIDSGRARYFSPFQQWRPVLTVPGVTFVNLQYGEAAAELAEAKAKLGVDIRQPPGLDLKLDLDDVTALTAALDLVVGPANATTNLAAAAGVPVWLISTPGAWPKLGTERYPWYPSVRVFSAPAYDQWGPVMAEVGSALRTFA
jgi:tetratricopeptide (TPR) repeat protein